MNTHLIEVRPVFLTVGLLKGMAQNSICPSR